MSIANVFTIFCALNFLAAFAQGGYLGRIKCSTTADDVGCPPPTHCTVTCTQQCALDNGARNIWGSGIYSYDSPICRSAVHDLRLVSWNTPMNVTFQRNFSDIGKYLGSIQQNIQSLDYGPLGRKGHYTFTSPYITEDILDVATLNYNFYHHSGNFVQLCSLDAQDAEHQISFRYYIPGVHIPTGSHNSSFGSQMAWDTSDIFPGGIWCHLQNNSLSNVMSLQMSSHANFVPGQWTVVASVHDDVTLQFEPLSNDSSLVWMKDGRSLRFFDNMHVNDSEHSLRINDVEVGDSGIYQYGNAEDEINERAIVRLVVRRCRDGYFGGSCEGLCPKCFNGGICHDVVGTCVCPPGFNGSFCEKSCPEGYVGQSCDKRCDATNSSCIGVLVCLPDPYGCSCAAGFKGIDCKQGCSAGEYGADCIQKRNCHCAANQSCDTRSGHCPRGCANGWTGAACDISYETTTTNSSTDFTTSDSCHGDDKYRLHVSLINTKCSQEVSSKEVMAIDLNDLQPVTEYNISVTSITKNGNAVSFWKIINILDTARG